jgi:hypothetical protein
MTAAESREHAFLRVLRAAAMDTAERFFLVVGLIFVLALVGVGLLPQAGRRSEVEAGPGLPRHALGLSSESHADFCRPFCLDI